MCVRIYWSSRMRQNLVKLVQGTHPPVRGAHLFQDVSKYHPVNFPSDSVATLNRSGITETSSVTHQRDVKTVTDQYDSIQWCARVASSNYWTVKVKFLLAAHAVRDTVREKVMFSQLSVVLFMSGLSLIPWCTRTGRKQDPFFQTEGPDGKEVSPGRTGQEVLVRKEPPRPSTLPATTHHPGQVGLGRGSPFSTSPCEIN